ncbi:MAG: 3'-5' exonuclease [Propionivibrio sp.]
MNWFSLLFASRQRQDAPVLTPGQQQAVEDWQGLPAEDLEIRHQRRRYVVVDVESSGLNMKKDRLISIGAVALINGQVDFNDAFQVVLRQERVSTTANILIHGIGGSAQSEGTEPAEALISFLRYIGKAPLIAYHAFFDQAMIDRALKEYLGMQLEQTWIDLAWVLPDFFQFRSNGRVALDDWLQLFGIENILRHNAVSDAYATAKLLQVAIAAGLRKGADSPASFVKIEKARRWLHESR